MSETKHTPTPGPWRVNKYGSIGAGEYGSEPIVAIVEPFYGPDKKYGDHAANARLIAAAPDMLEALKAVIGSHETLVIKDKPLPDARFETVSTEAIAAARAAAAKAEGRS